MTRARVAVLAALLGGCGGLTETDNGVAILQVQQPPLLSIAVGGTLQFSALAFDKAGKPVDVEIRWRTPDTTISVTETSGLVTGRFAGPGRVQAVTGTESTDPKKFTDFLASAYVTVTVTAPPAPARRP